MRGEPSNEGSEALLHRDTGAGDAEGERIARVVVGADVGEVVEEERNGYVEYVGDAVPLLTTRLLVSLVLERIRREKGGET